MNSERREGDWRIMYLKFWSKPFWLAQWVCRETWPAPGLGIVTPIIMHLWCRFPFWTCFMLFLIIGSSIALSNDVKRVLTGQSKGLEVYLTDACWVQPTTIPSRPKAGQGLVTKIVESINVQFKCRYSSQCFKRDTWRRHEKWKHPASQPARQASR